MSCEDIETKREVTATADPRIASSPARTSDPSPPSDYGTHAAVVAASAPAQSAAPPLSAADCKAMPDALLDHQATALRARLSRSVSYPERARDTEELKNVEAELQSREDTQRKAAQAAHGGVKVCHRVADLPGNSVIGVPHKWIQTTNKEAGMGEVDGSVPGHGESAPRGLQTRLVDHSKEPRDGCDVQPGIDEDCVDRELQLGKDTGTWIPGINDCHNVVKGILDKCQPHTLENVLNADTERKLREADGGVP